MILCNFPSIFRSISTVSGQILYDLIALPDRLSCIQLCQNAKNFFYPFNRICSRSEVELVVEFSRTGRTKPGLEVCIWVHQALPGHTVIETKSMKSLMQSSLTEKQGPFVHILQVIANSSDPIAVSSPIDLVSLLMDIFFNKSQENSLFILVFL